MLEYKGITARGVMTVYRALIKKPHTVEQLCELANLSKYCVRKIIAELNDEITVVRMDKDRLGRDNVPVYTWSRP